MTQKNGIAKILPVCAAAMLISILLPGHLTTAASAEAVTLTTYYPAPFGSYDRLRLVPHDTNADPVACTAENQGLTFYDEIADALMVCNAPGSPSPVGTWNYVDTNTDGTHDGAYLIGTETNYDLNVGIGTTDPQRRFHIVEDSAGTPSMLSLQNIDTTDNNGMCLSFRGVTTDTSGIVSDFHEYAYVKASFPEHDHSASQGNLSLGVRTPGASINTPAVFIESNNVGIGTTNPQARLHIDQPLGIPVLIEGENLRTTPTVDSSTYLFIRDTTGGTLWGLQALNNGDFAIHQSGLGSPVHIQKDTYNVAIGGGTNPQASLDVSGQAFISGDVGIGNTSPQTTLDVAGPVRTRPTTFPGNSGCNDDTRGTIMFDPDTDSFRGCTNSGWIDLAVGTGGTECSTVKAGPTVTPTNACSGTGHSITAWAYLSTNSYVYHQAFNTAKGHEILVWCCD